MKKEFDSEAFIRQEKRVIAYFKQELKNAKRDYQFRIKRANKRIKEAQKNLKLK